MYRNAKIVATLGPASSSETILRSMIEAGLDVARLNFSHGRRDEHAALIASIRKLSDRLNKPVTILQDLQGPKLRVGMLPEGGVEIKAGQRIVLTRLDKEASLPDRFSGRVVIPMDVPELAKSVSKGSYILMDDGHLELEVTDIAGEAVEAEVILGGVLTSNKGVNLPGARFETPGFTGKDRMDLAFGLEHEVDAVAISFVRSARDVEIVRDAIRDMAPSLADTPIIAKIELPDALENLEEITEAADGVMVARGDLAVETSPATVPIVQKKIIDTANRHAKVVITATQMLESMIDNPRPTRAEASDVANAILDGADAVMLSAESAIGRYPVESVKMMEDIILESERHMQEFGRAFRKSEGETGNDAISTTRAARELAHDVHVSNVAVFTKSGQTALLMGKARPGVPILAFTPELRTYRRLGLYWGVTPFLVPFSDDVEAMLAYVEEAIVAGAGLQAGQQVVLVSGFPVSAGTPPNLALLYTLGQTRRL